MVETSNFKTLALALPGSVIENTQTWEQAAMLSFLSCLALSNLLIFVNNYAGLQVAGQVARAATVFNIHEVVIFDDSGAVDKGWELFFRCFS